MNSITLENENLFMQKWEGGMLSNLWAGEKFILEIALKTLANFI